MALTPQQSQQMSQTLSAMTSTLQNISSGLSKATPTQQKQISSALGSAGSVLGTAKQAIGGGGGGGGGNTLSRIGEKFGVQPQQQQQQQQQQQYTRYETLKDGTIVGYKANNNWEVVQTPQKGGVQKAGTPQQQLIQPQRDEQKMYQMQGMFDEVAMKQDKLPISKGQSLYDQFSNYLKKTSQPAQQSSVSQFQQYQQQYLDPLENEYQTARTGLTEFENTLYNEADKIKGEPVSSTVINRKLVKLDADTAQQLRAKQNEVQTAQSRLENKQKMVGLMMQYTNQDYQNAQENYQFEYNKAFQLYSLLSGQEDKQRDDARANLQVIQGMIKDKPNAFQDFDFKNYTEKLELQSGLPIGMTESFVNAKPNAKILLSNQYEGVTQVFYEDPENPGAIGQVQSYGVGEDSGTGLTPGGKVPITKAESIKLNKELVINDAYKAIRKSQDSLQYLDTFEKTFKQYGLTTIPGTAKGKLGTTYQTTLLNLKEFFNLGVLNGPDLEVLQGIMPDPTTGFFKKFRGRASAVDEGIKNMKVQIENTLDDRIQSVMAQYGDYDLDSLNDAKRVYIEQKIKLNPEISQMIQDNPDLSIDDIMSVIIQ